MEVVDGGAVLNSPIKYGSTLDQTTVSDESTVKRWLQDDEDNCDDGACLFDDAASPTVADFASNLRKLGQSTGLFSSPSGATVSYFEVDDDDGGVGGVDASLSSSSFLGDAARLPACQRLNGLLSERGYAPLTLSPKDVDVVARTVSSDLMNAWAESLLGNVRELLQALDRARSTVHDVSLSVRRGGLSHGALQARVATLEAQLKEARGKAARAELSTSCLEEERTVRSAEKKSSAGDALRALRVSEQAAQALQVQLAQARKEGVEARRRQALLEEQVAALGKQKKAAEADAVRVTKAGEGRAAALQAQLSQALRRAEEAERKGAGFEAEKLSFAEQRRTVDAAVAQLTRAHEAKVTLLQTQVNQAAKRAEAAERHRAQLEEEKASAAAKLGAAAAPHRSHDRVATTTAAMQEQRIQALQERLDAALAQVRDAEARLATAIRH